ncbi:MAG: type II toxin-antitoxin system VapB family antitoxin [Aestuariivirga sp.]
MKTTVHIPDALLEDAQRLARRDGTTLKALVQEGLRRVVDERKRQKSFKLRDASFEGEGIDPALNQASWDRIRDMAYEGRGG